MRMEVPRAPWAGSVLQTTRIIAAFAQLKAGGTTIVLVEQNLGFARRLGDRVAVMDNGRVVHAGGMAEFSADAALQQSLLGLSL